LIKKLMSIYDRQKLTVPAAAVIRRGFG